MAAGLVGAVVGGVFAEHLHWSLIFWINVPLAVVSLAMLLPKMGKIPVFHRKRKVDWLGGVLLMASAVAVMLVLTWGCNRYPWLSPTILAMMGPAIALARVFSLPPHNTQQTPPPPSPSPPPHPAPLPQSH